MPTRKKITRCLWCGTDAAYVAYHDNHWGRPLSAERELFKWLTLETFQAGLSWLTVLKKEANFNQAFFNWDIERLTALTQSDLSCLRQNAGIIRNQKKIAAVKQNAAAFASVSREFNGFINFLRHFTGGQVIRQTPRRSLQEALPATTPLAEKISRQMKKRGFAFAGPIVVYSYLQAIGIVDDHAAGCFVAAELDTL